MRTLNEIYKNNIVGSSKKRKRDFLRLIVLAFSLFVVIAATWYFFKTDKFYSNKIESAILANDWQRVYDECLKEDSLFAKPETAALVGHSSIMLNKNNESYILFQYLNADSMRVSQWQIWALNFQNRFPKKSVTNYLLGDAYYRNGNPDKALEFFNKALKTDPKYSLALNARGTVFALQNDKNKALNDYNVACSHDPNIAEFIINRATLKYNNKAPEGAYHDFELALKNSPSSALALNGKACAMVFNSQPVIDKENELDTISCYFYKASVLLPAPFIQYNTRTLTLDIENRIAPDLTESPFFRFSDFLDWDFLRQRNLIDKYDLLRIILQDTLPRNISLEFLVNLNSKLSNRDVFINYLIDNSVPDSLKSIITKTLKVEIVYGKSEKEKIECRNRLVIENFYEGLIASFTNRLTGMHIENKRETYYRYGQTTGQHSFDYYQKRQDWNERVWRPAAEAVKLGGTAISAGGHPYIGLAVTSAGYAWAEYTRQDMRKTDKYLRQPKPPGGVLVDIKRVSVDDNKPYFLICPNGLGYVSK